MTALKPTFSIDPKIWDQFVAQHPQGHILQTNPWGTLKSDFGWADERIALTHGGDELIAGAQILYRRLPAGAGQLAYVPKGPLVDWEDEEQVTALIDALDQAAQSRDAIAISLEPNLRDCPAHREQLEALNLHPAPFDAIQPRRTLVVDITPDEEDILMAMKSKTRYNIRLAGRKGVEVREAKEDEVSIFTDLLAATAERADFGIHPPAYYEAAYRLFVPRDQARLLLAEVEGQPVAGLMVLALPPHSWYFYGASSTAHREKMPTYRIQWEAIRWAKSMGCTTYDLWGVPDADREQLEDQFTERHDGLWGVYRFKRGFGGELVRSVGAWDRVYAPVRYQVYAKALSIREELLSSESPDD